MTDASPTLVQPDILTQMARCFIPVSIELMQDWGSLQENLTRLIFDAKNTLEATKFLTGTGTNEPSGILNIGGTNGLTTTQRVLTTTTAVYAVGDPWLLKRSFPLASSRHRRTRRGLRSGTRRIASSRRARRPSRVSSRTAIAAATSSACRRSSGLRWSSRPRPAAGSCSSATSDEYETLVRERHLRVEASDVALVLRDLREVILRVVVKLVVGVLGLARLEVFEIFGGRFVINLLFHARPSC